MIVKERSSKICSYMPESALHANTRLHDIVVERRPMVFCHKDRFNKQAHLVTVFPKSYGCFEPLVIRQCRHNNCYINITPRVGIAFGVRAIHHDLDLAIEAR